MVVLFFALNLLNLYTQNQSASWSQGGPAVWPRCASRLLSLRRVPSRLEQRTRQLSFRSLAKCLDAFFHIGPFSFFFFFNYSFLSHGVFPLPPSGPLDTGDPAVGWLSGPSDEAVSGATAFQPQRSRSPGSGWATAFLSLLSRRGPYQLLLSSCDPVPCDLPV